MESEFGQFICIQIDHSTMWFLQAYELDTLCAELISEKLKNLRKFQLICFAHSSKPKPRATNMGGNLWIEWPIAQVHTSSMSMHTFDIFNFIFDSLSDFYIWWTNMIYEEYVLRGTSSIRIKTNSGLFHIII